MVIGGGRGGGEVRGIRDCVEDFEDGGAGDDEVLSGWAGEVGGYGVGDGGGREELGVDFGHVGGVVLV